ncbi:MAG TPA: hypothetical protein VM737_11660 [Gemmatimonadota bacterium]|nr:hypothetical protein [Gemmatimonadota bacterium]
MIPLPRSRFGRALLAAAGLSLWLGLEAAAARAQEPRRVPPRQVEPQRVPSASRYVNLSELLYRPLLRTTGDEIYEEGEPSDPSITPTAKPAEARPIAAVLWNTETGRRALESRVLMHGPLVQPTRVVPGAGAPQRVPPAARRQPAWTGGPVCIIPTVTREGSTCCNYTQPDQLAGTDVTYRQPLSVFGTEHAAREFAATVRASMPMFLPYHDPDVLARHGWIYNGSDRRFHGAVDYSQPVDPGDDPAFEVRSIAGGVVVAVYWDDWSGNIVTIEHTAPNGDRYRSNYKHLRNGYLRDLQMARGLPKVAVGDRFDDDGNATSRYKYELFANLPSPSELLWGTNAQRIQVEVGENVRAGQRIGWSGNTGPGGAGGGLEDDGTPKNPDTGNNHLHLMIAVPDPINPGDWVQVDPYGVYNQISDSGCYDLLDESGYVRLFAPFYPSFHNVPAQYVGFYWGYYTGMGMGLQTISLHRRGGEVLASGAFQRGLPPAWYMRMFMTGDEYQEWFDTYGAQGFRPRQIKVTPDAGGAPRFTVIWKKAEGESVAAYHGLTDADWDARWQEHVVAGKMRVGDRVAYRQGNGRRLAAVFVKDGGSPGFAELHYMTGADYQAKFDEFGDGGLTLVDAEAEELPEGLRFGGIWEPRPGSWAARHGLSPAQYQEAFEELSAQGFRLYDIQGYADSERFIAVWTKP